MTINVDPFAVTCPVCGALPHLRCKDLSGLPARISHHERYVAAIEAVQAS